MYWSDKPMKNILHAGEGEHLFVLTDLVTVKILAKDTANQYSVIHETVPPQNGPPPHQHAEVEIFYVMEGEFEFLLEDLYNPVRVEPPAGWYTSRPKPCIPLRT
jgi:quercetin dioxygenase-like cupin family protein